MITFRQLRYFQALARHRHFGRAAAACAVTQPALSMQIRELEQELGAELVERRSGDVVLTELGREIAQRAEHVLAGARDLIDYAHHRSRPMAGPLKLGLIPTVAPYVLPKLLPALQQDYPELQLEVRETQTKVLVDELAAGSVDVLLLALPVGGAEIETLDLFEDPFLLAVPADDEHPVNARVSPRDIDEERLILLEEGHCLRDQALTYCQNARGAGTLGLGATSLDTVMQMVANGYGVTLVPRIAADVTVRDERIKLLRFMPPEPGRKIGLAWRRTAPRKSDFAALGDVIKTAMAPTLAKAHNGSRVKTKGAAHATPNKAAAKPRR